MTDIVERLHVVSPGYNVGPIYQLIREAADEIEGLRTDVEAYRIAKFRDNDEIDRLRAALRETLDLLSDGPGGPQRVSAIRVAEQALDAQKGDYHG